MSAMLTAERLSDIARRAFASRFYGLDPRDRDAVQQVLDDRAAIIALLSAVAKVDWTAYGRCLACDHAEGHGPDCPAPVLDALRAQDGPGGGP